MLAFTRKSPERSAALDRVREWVRGRFSLPDDAAILVAEVACAVPGCPPLETVIAFWSDERRHHFKVFKPVAEVVCDDLRRPGTRARSRCRTISSATAAERAVSR